MENYGRYLVSPEYRRQGIMSNLEKILIDEAKKKNLEYLIATAHPNNVASIKTLEKAGLKLIKPNIYFEGYLRNVYIMKNY